MTSTRAETPVPTPADVATAAQVGDEAHALLHPDQTARDFVTALLGASLFPDAVRFIAYALPRREAVWWALLCAREAAGETPSHELTASLEATETWVRHPGDDQRRAAM